MKYLKLYERFEDNASNSPWWKNINKICEKYNIVDYAINSDGSIDVDNAVILNNKNLTKLPLKFNIINDPLGFSYFDCSVNKLKSLEGSPKEINGGGLYCSENKLTSFQYAPKIIRGEFSCEYNNIKSFEYFPSFIEGEFLCWVNPIFEVWDLFQDTTKIELLNDFDIFRDEDKRIASIVMDRLNDFLLTIGEDPVESVNEYKNI